jgi:hypothetical protein
LDCDGAVFAGGSNALSGSLVILGRLRGILESAIVRIDGVSGKRRVEAIGCGETVYGGW